MRSDTSLARLFTTRTGELYPAFYVAGYLTVVALFCAWLFVIMPEDVLITRQEYLNVNTARINEEAVGWLVGILPMLLSIAGFFVSVEERRKNPMTAALFGVVGFASLLSDIVVDTYFKMGDGAPLFVAAFETVMLFTFFSEVLATLCLIIIVEDARDFLSAIGAVLEGNVRQPVRSNARQHKGQRQTGVYNEQF